MLSVSLLFNSVNIQLNVSFLSGMFAVISLMTGTLVSEAKQELLAASSLTTDHIEASKTSHTETSITITSGHHSPSMEFDGVNIQIAVAVSFLIGIYQLIFGVFQMGFVSVYLSEHLVSKQHRLVVVILIQSIDT